MGAMNKMAAKKSKYDEVIKLPVSFEKAMGVLAKAAPKTKTKRRS